LEIPTGAGDTDSLTSEQSISLLDTLDKDINTFAMRVKEWYGWHFPELVRTLPSRGCLRAPVLKRSRPRISLH
jgi:nucleolar protein 56